MAKIERSLNGTIKHWLHKNYITKQTYFLLFSSDSSLPKAYSLSKVHKVNFSLRIIVSSVNTALYQLSKFLRKIINDSLIYNNRHGKNSFELYKALSNTKINSNDVLISLDTISLFTNIPIDLAVQSITKRWAHIEKNTCIPFNEFISTICFILTSTYFTVNNNIYKQTFGTLMGFPLSPIIADVVLQDLEEKALDIIGLNLPFYHRYVDNIVLAALSEHTSHILNTFNSIHDRLKFTIEYEKNRSLSFLDFLLKVVDDKIIIDWYHKSCFSGRCLSYFSSHPSCHKIGTIYSLLDRTMLLSHPTFQQKNIEICVKILLENDYPLDLIF